MTKEVKKEPVKSELDIQAEKMAVKTGLSVEVIKKHLIGGK